MEDFNTPPVYDEFTKIVDQETGREMPGDLMSDVFMIWIGEFYNTIIQYLTSNGIMFPQITTADRDGLNNVVNGTTIYNTTVDAPQIYQAGAWKTFTTF
jgi:hypothetical protein